MIDRRDDLLAMTIEVLVLMTNRGIVNRAVRESRSSAAHVEQTSSGLRAVFETGQVVEVDNGVSIGESSCTCGSVAMCRHRIGFILAYQAHFDDEVDDAQWSPGDFTDDELMTHVGERVMRHAHRVRTDGYAATVHRDTGGREFRVDLPTATVRFLVPRALDHAYTSANDRLAAVTIVLAVWAVREADRVGVNVVHVEDSMFGLTQEAPRSGVALGIVESVLRAGASNVTDSLLAGLRRELTELTEMQQTWIVDTAADLLQAVVARGERHSTFNRRRMSELLVELHNRTLLAESTNPLVARNASGVDVAPETPIRRTIFIGLGALRSGTAESSAVDIYLYDRSAHSVHLWRHDVPRVKTVDQTGSRTYLIASGSAIAESAIRLAGNRLRFSRAGPKSVSLLPPDPRVWSTLGDSVYIADYTSLRTRLAQRLPRFARPRHAVDSMFILDVARVGSVDYTPGEQTLRGWIYDAEGNRALIETEHRSESSGSLDVIADALGTPTTAVSGHVRLRGGELLIDPTAMVVRGTIVVPQLIANAPMTTLLPGAPDELDPIVAMIDSALDLLGELAERGLGQPLSGSADSVDEIRRHASRLGMRETADALAALSATIRGDAIDHRYRAWLDVATRLVVASEVRQGTCVSNDGGIDG